LLCAKALSCYTAECCCSAEQQSSRAAEQQSSRAAEQQSSRAAEQQSSSAELKNSKLRFFTIIVYWVL
jgi:alpha-D-ribose 1-methylphosphonate 5-triphosphate synthase subunit PhnG